MFNPKTDSIRKPGDPGVKVEFLQQWSGHDKGAVATLTTDRAKELAGQGIVKDYSEPQLKEAAQPKRTAKRKQTNVNPHSYNRPSDRADNTGGSP